MPAARCPLLSCLLPRPFAVSWERHSCRDPSAPICGYPTAGVDRGPQPPIRLPPGGYSRRHPPPSSPAAPHSHTPPASDNTTVVAVPGGLAGGGAPCMASAGRILPAPPTTLIPGPTLQPHHPATDKTAASAARTEYVSRLSRAVGRGENREGRVSLPSRSAFTVTQC